MKMNKTYEAPMAKVIELQTIGVLMASDGGDAPTGRGWHGATVGYESVDIP